MIIGIDLGTTNSACAVFRNGETEMIPNRLGQVLTPSAVSLDDNGNLLTGLAARERQSTHPDHTVTAFKRFMGTQQLPQLGKRKFTPEDLSALILRTLKEDAEEYLGEAVHEAVITVPAYFNDKQRKATRRAGELAGLKVERLINEPTAAALSYGLHQREKETQFLVFDLGGGTFDVSLLQIFEGIIEVRATAGDNRLGGEDFNEAIIKIANHKLDLKTRDKQKYRGALYQKLRVAAEKARRSLTVEDSVDFSVVWEGEEHTFELTADAFAEACEPLLTRLRDPVVRSLRDSKTPVETIDEIIFVGGATRMPLVRKAATKMFGRFPSHAIDPDEAVARGAAIQAALKSRDADLSDVVLTDVSPYSLGVDATEREGHDLFTHGVFMPIIERNCVIPASREHTFGTVYDNQTEVQFGIYQGESRWVKNNIRLGEITVRVPRAKSGEIEILCRFTYDINGLLEVDVNIPSTGEHRQLVIVDKDTLSDEDIKKRRAELAKIKTHPRDVEAHKSAMARAERCYENAVGEERDYIGKLISSFSQVLERQDPTECEEARVQLHNLLNSIEGESYL